METYHKINAPFKRHMDGPKKGKLIHGAWCLPEFEYLAGNEWEFTEKMDGTNIRIGLTRIEDTVVVRFAGRSDNATIPAPLLTALEELFPSHPTKSMPPGRSRVIADWMDENGITHATLYGEGIGPKIQSGGNYTSKHTFVLFDVKIGDFWLNRTAVESIAGTLFVNAVPLIGAGTLQDAIDIVSSGLTWDKNGKMTRWGGYDAQSKRNFSGLKSCWGQFEAEGIVARPAVPLFDRQGNRIIVKIKGRDFK